jgi:hypothetical protein
MACATTPTRHAAASIRYRAEDIMQSAYRPGFLEDAAKISNEYKFFILFKNASHCVRKKFRWKDWKKITPAEK